jgi:hypothetical protein
MSGRKVGAASAAGVAGLSAAEVGDDWAAWQTNNDPERARNTAKASTGQDRFMLTREPI